MKIIFKIFGCAAIFVITFYLIFNGYLYHERDKEYEAVQHLLVSSPKWSNVKVHHSVSWRLIVVGSVDSEKAMDDLRKELKEIGARKTTVNVQIVPHQIPTNSN